MPPAPAANSLASLQQPLLPAASSSERGGTPAAAVAAAEAGQGLQPRARSPGEAPGGKRKEAAAWRATLPGTVACTLALFVQKMVRPPCLGDGQRAQHPGQGCEHGFASMLRGACYVPAWGASWFLRTTWQHALPRGRACRCSSRIWTACPCSQRCCTPGMPHRRACSWA